LCVSLVVFSEWIIFEVLTFGKDVVFRTTIRVSVRSFVNMAPELVFVPTFNKLLSEPGAAHIHDAGNKKQGNKLRRLMTYAWPCLLSKNCVDPTTRYHGHLLVLIS
jgi:hypothetical protein